MGFCRRCGDIVQADRCNKCGGTAVAPSVKFDKKEGVKDRWSKTYTASSSTTSAPSEKPKSEPRTFPTKAAPPSAPAPAPVPASASTTRAPSRFPRPQSGYGVSTSPPKQSGTLNRISAHIASTTAPRPTSPLKPTPTGSRDYSSDITVVKSHITGALVKVHGSILERPESLANFACYECLMKFAPDATIYPSPSDADKFLCRACFESHEDAARGVCEACHKPVFALSKEEGGAPVENAGRIWHAGCFRCKACGVDIAKNPMVDILGRPCCEECFDECLKNGEPSPSPKPPARTRTLSSKSGAGAESDEAREARARAGSRSREGTPQMMDELSKRLGISSPSSSPKREEKESGGRVGEISPTIERLTRKLNAIVGGDASPTPKSQSQSQGSARPFLTANLKSVAQHRIASSASTSSSSVSTTSSSYSPGSLSTEDSFASSVTSTATSSPANSPPPTKGLRLSNSSNNESTPTKIGAGGAQMRRSLIPVPTRHSLSSALSSSSAIPPAPPPPPPSSLPYAYTTPQSKRLSTIPGSTETTPTVSKNNTPIATGAGASKSTPTHSYKSSPFANSPSTRVAAKTKTHNGSRDSPLHAFTTPDALIKGSCDACQRPLLAQDLRGPIVTVPLTKGESDDEDEDVAVERFHHSCFRCGNCGDSFGELDGKANFVRENGKPVHISCASPLRPPTTTSVPVKSVYPSPIPPPVFDRSSSVPESSRRPPSAASSTKDKAPQAQPQQSPRGSVPLGSSGSVSPTSSGRFTCGGCKVTVFQMERGVVPGPQGGKWHLSCLVCGGKDWKTRAAEAKRWGSDEVDIGCGKKLDSQARTDRLGRVFCRDCLNNLPADLRGAGSPTRAAITPMDTGTSVYGRVNMNYTPAPADDSANGAVGKLVTHFTGSSSGPFSGGHAYPTNGDYLSRSETPAPGGVRARSVSPVRRQITGGSGYMASRGASPVKSHLTGGGGFPSAAPLVPQVTGGGLPITHAMRPHSVIGTRNISPVKTHWTGSSTTSNDSVGAAAPIVPQTTGGLFVTRPRPKSVLGTRGGSTHRGIELVRQATGGEWKS